MLGFLRGIKRLFGRPAEPVRLAGRPGILARVMRARYDAAQTTTENVRHWAMADGLSANAANSADVRQTLRNRARYEIANNSYARGITLTLANDIVGTGPRLQMLNASAEANRRVEKEFSRWAEEVRLAERLRTMCQAQSCDGEGFGVLTNNPALSSPVKLDLRLVEAEQVTTPMFRDAYPNSVDGIVFDAHGNPVEYHILKEHPGDVFSRLMMLFDRVPAASVIHLFRADRPGQARGVPEVMSALPLFAQLRRYTLAVLAAAETAAEFAGVLYTDAPPNGESDAIEPMDTIELEKRMLLTMPGGWKMEQVRAEQPSTSYGEFKKELLNEIARCVNMPFNVAAGNSSGYNYASGRLDHQTYFKFIRVKQSHIESVVLDRVFEAWAREAVLVEGLLPQEMRLASSDWSHQWFWDGQEHVDPLKEAKAQESRLRSHTTTLADEYARRGQDWEVQLRQRAKEQALMDELGLRTAEAVPAGSAGEEE